MKTLLEILEFYTTEIFQAVLIGHSIFYIWNLIRKNFLNNIHREVSYPIIEKKLLHLLGIMYIICFAVLTIYRLNNSNQYGINYHDRMFGMYGFAYWTFPIIGVGICSIRQVDFKWKSIVLFVLSVVFLIPMETVAQSLTLQRDYLPMTGEQDSMWIIWWPIVRNYIVFMMMYLLGVESIHRVINRVNKNPSGIQHL
ncbi:MAG: hypothetical protein IPM69_10365 [Ignavibacteria bacterium]|nr:hypothetical protein [Ignavibacteria bacterium]